MSSNDVVGKKFGKLTVLRYDNKKKRYECLCNCGNRRFNCAKDLLDGSVFSCGCVREKMREKARKSWIGKKVGKMTIVRYLGLRERKTKPGKFQSFYELECICGKKVERSVSHLTQRQTCGCSRKDPVFIKKFLKRHHDLEEVIAIRKLKDTYSIKELAEMFGRSYESVLKIVKGVYFKDVENKN